MSTYTCAILSGGEILDYAAVKEELPATDFIICADSGYRHCRHLDCQPDLLVGDFDSIGQALPDGVPVVRLSADKDYTDTALACEEAVSRGAKRIYLAGFSGGRLDHTLANLQTLAGLSARGIECHMTDGRCTVYALTASAQGNALILQPRPRHYFSVFAFSGVCKNVAIQGGKYPLERYDLRFDEARAVSNEFLDGPVTVSLDEGTLLVTTTPFDR
ncbi:thiamine diphosphokinase [Ruminococcaceae bacterium OttesenSCG-928-L11]|nr:thiamine diphosphokinase [Ruminococcaceae bacterium OttesenSCG-928-L11]